MKSGYDQFFKNARSAQNKNSNSAVKKSSRASVQRQVEEQLSEIAQSQKINTDLKKKMNVRKRKAVFHPALIFSFFGFVVCLFGFIYHEDLEKIVQKVEVSFIGEVQASDPKPEANESKETKLDSQSANVEKPPEAKVEIADDEHFLKLQSRKVELDQREEELKRKELAIQEKEVALEKRLKELEEMRGKISAILEERTKTDEKKIETLVQVYTNMKPPQAAKVFETLDEDLAVELLGRMKKKSAADIMNLLKPEKAQLFSERIAGYRLPASNK